MFPLNKKLKSHVNKLLKIMAETDVHSFMKYIHIALIIYQQSAEESASFSGVGATSALYVGALCLLCFGEIVMSHFTQQLWIQHVQMTQLFINFAMLWKFWWSQFHKTNHQTPTASCCLVCCFWQLIMWLLWCENSASVVVLRNMLISKKNNLILAQNLY